MSNRKKLLVRTIVALLCTAISTVTIFSQTSTLAGIVLDPQGNALAGVKITITNKEKNFSRNVTSSSEGKYQFPQISPGIYSVRAEAKGFASLVEENVQILINTPLTLNLTFTKLGEISETITVQSEGSILNGTDATIGNNFTAPQISTLPLEGRNVVSLLSLQPGVTRSGYVTGSRSDQANVVLDGIDVNEQQTGLDPIMDGAFSSVLRSTPDSIQEFRVTTTNPNANQGRSSGGQVELITNSGTNKFHGSLYEYHRNTITTANNFFNNRTINPDTGKSLPTPKLIRNVFGGAIGGPIKTNRVFFFYNYEGRRDAAEETVLRPVPLASMGRGQLTFPEEITLANGTKTIVNRTLSLAELNKIFPEVGMNPAGLAILANAAKKYPANSSEEGDGLNYGGYRFNAPKPLKWNTNIAKIDMNLSDKHNLFIRGNYQMDNIGLTQQFPDTLSPNIWYHPYGFSIGHTWTANSNIVNKVNYGLTRLALSRSSDSEQNSVNFRFVYQPYSFSRKFQRTNPTHNITDDLSWVKGNHTFQFGTNIRIVRNNRTNFANSFDAALTNPSFYDGSGSVLSDPILDSFNVEPGFISPLRTVMSALIGRYSQYESNFNFDINGSLLPIGTGVSRSFATEQYDWYGQDSWKIGKSLTLNIGLRYGLNSPVYEKGGFEVKPTLALGEYFERRKASSATGIPYNTPIEVDLAGPTYNRPGYYPWDVNNFQPRISIAWSPNFENGFLKKIFGGPGKSVIRGGFAMIHDQIGQQLAVFFDGVSTLGFSSSQVISANTYNVTDNPAPRFTGLNPNVRVLPGIITPDKLRFPLMTPSDEAERIEASLDENLVTPVNYSWNFSISRELPLGITVEGSYIGRLARNLLATRDIMALNNLVDPKSGTDWYTAATQLVQLRNQNTQISNVKPIAYFENLFPDYKTTTLTPTQRVYRLLAREFVDNDESKGVIGGRNIADYTFIQAIIDDRGIYPNMFFHPQYAAFSTFSTVAGSDYHAATLTVKQRLRNHLYFDFNYTFSKSMDTASGLQTSTGFGSAFILNPLRPDDNRAVSDFDVRHIITTTGVWDLPIGPGKKFFSGMNRFGNALFGGWQLSSIFRWNSGLPVVDCCFDKSVWATNWNVQSNGIRTKPIESSPTKKTANLFSDPVAAYRSFRNPYPGETGERNIFRIPGYVSLDLGISKSFTMPWSESHKIEFRWDIFNATNTQRLGEVLDTRDGIGIDVDPQIGTPPSTFGNFIGIQGDPRVMQFALRYKF